MVTRTDGFRAIRALLAGLCLVLIAAAATWAEEGRRVALVIGNSDYAHVPPLINPTNDATDLGAVLRDAGFEVTVRHDLDQRDMRVALRDFAREAAEAAVSLVYFAGHGIEVNKVNYMIPVSAEMRNDSDVAFEAVSLDNILEVLGAAPGVRIVLVDACRDNPFRRMIAQNAPSRSLGRGLGRVDPTSGVIVGYAAREGTMALDGEGRNSPYAAALIRRLQEPGLELGRLFRLVRDDVLRATGGAQEPFTYGSLPGEDIYLTPPAEEVALLPQTPAPDTALVDAFAAAEARGNLTAWRGFLDRWGGSDNALTGIAERRLAALEQAAEARRIEAARRPWLRPDTKLHATAPLSDLTLEERRRVQVSLGYMGFDTGGVDGQFGPKTRNAITAARLRAGLSPLPVVDGALLLAMPDPALVEGLKSDKARTYRAADLPSGLEPRLAKALGELAGKMVVFDYFEGRLYLAVRGYGMAWTIANHVAQRAGGHLATIDSPAENRFLHDLFMRDDGLLMTDSAGHQHGPLIGLFQRDGSAEPRGGWTWVTGEPMNYTNRAPGNPDNYRGTQKYGSFYVNRTNRDRGRRPLTWDDVSGSTSGYLIEIE